MHSIVEEFLELIKDGQWHSTNEITVALDQQEDLVKDIISFYKEFGFIETDKNRTNIIIDAEIRDLFP